MLIRSLTILTVIMLYLSVNSHAADLGTANSFNVFIFGSAYTPGGHSDGAVVVGGAWSSGYLATQHANQKPFGVVGKTTNIGVLVGGSLASSGAQVNCGADMYVGGAKTGSVLLNGGGKSLAYSNISSTVFSDQKTLSLFQSAQIAKLTGAAIDMNDSNNWKINASLQAGHQKVYTIDASKLASSVTLNVSNLYNTDTLFINVTGQSVAHFGVTVNSNSKANRILWNFADATSINIDGRELYGSILAPNANVIQSQNINGNLIASGWTVRNNAEMHAGANVTFNGDVPAAPVPEPAFMQLGALLSGAGLMALRARKRG